MILTFEDFFLEPIIVGLCSEWLEKILWIWLDSGFILAQNRVLLTLSNGNKLWVNKTDKVPTKTGNTLCNIDLTCCTNCLKIRKFALFILKFIKLFSVEIFAIGCKNR